MKTTASNRKQLSDVPVGQTFKIGDLEFIVLESHDGYAAVILKDCWKTAKFDSTTNNYAKSYIRKELNGKFYTELTKLIDANAIMQHDVDLTSDDGRKDYGIVEDYVSLLTGDLYRKYVLILDKYRPKGWWWLATPYSTASNGYLYTARCVFDNGALVNGGCRVSGSGVRPFCIFLSSIFVS